MGRVWSTLGQELNGKHWRRKYVECTVDEEVCREHYGGLIVWKHGGVCGEH